MEEQSIEKIVIPITQCVPGMIVMQSIMDEHTGTVILGKDQILTAEAIDKIKKFEHTQVWISLPSKPVNDPVWKASEETIQTYREYAHILQSVLEEIKEKKSLSIHKLVEVAEHMINHFSDYYSVLACVHLLNQMESDEYVHSVNVASSALVLGKWLEYDEITLKSIIIASLLHDVGKLDINPILMHKSEEEMNSMERLEFRRHPILGYERLVPYNELDIEVLKGVLTHHERCDGSGYPLALRDNKIGDIARVIGIADVYNELKEKYSIFEVVKILETQMLRKLDVNMVLLFCNNLMNYYVGAKVLLNTGKIGQIAYIQSQAIYRPVIKVEGEYINLYEKPHLEIISLME